MEFEGPKLMNFLKNRLRICNAMIVSVHWPFPVTGKTSA